MKTKKRNNKSAAALKMHEKEQLVNNIAAIRVAMLTTKGEDGMLHSRPMYTLEIDDKGRLWFYTNKNTLKTKEIEKRQKVNIAYSDMHTHTYISISGRAFEIDDTQRERELWDPALEAWFPNGPYDDNVRLLVVEPENAAFWDKEKSMMKTGLSFK